MSNIDTQTSPGIGLLPSKFSVLGGCIIDVLGVSGKRVTAQISAGRLYKGWVPASPNWLQVGSITFDGAAMVAALGASIVAANIRITLYDGDSGSPNPVYTAMFGSGNFPYLRSTSQPGNYDFDGGNNLYFGFEDVAANPISCGYMGASTTYRLNAAGVTHESFTGWPGCFALTDITNFPTTPRPAQYMTPVQAGQAPGVWPVTGWFQVPGPNLDDLYAALSTGVIRFGLYDVSPGDQYLDFTQGLASDVIEIPFNTVPPTIPPQYAWLDLWVWRELTKFTDVNQSLNFAPGYEKALLYALACEFFPEYPAAEKKYDFGELLADAKDALNDLEILNASDAVAMEPSV